MKNNIQIIKMHWSVVFPNGIGEVEYIVDWKRELWASYTGYNTPIYAFSDIRPEILTFFKIYKANTKFFKLVYA